ncbi:MAG: hypothetical protein AAFO94_02315 [Bacteroidota bacterium]
MKKSIGLRSALFTLLILASIGSYVYLNLVDVVNESVDPTPLQLQAETEQSENQQVLMPDVEIIKRVVEKGLDLIPK